MKPPGSDVRKETRPKVASGAQVCGREERPAGVTPSGSRQGTGQTLEPLEHLAVPAAAYDGLA